MKKQAFNPYLPSWEYIPDGEPYVFGDRVYIYGSHDFYNGYVFCMGDYVCWSAPVDDLGNWRYEGVIYPKISDPLNRDGKMCLYAPDVTVGPDGRYYLYYVLDHVSIVSVAVCDTPAGTYEFYGYVHYEDGTRLGEKPGDEPQFDPGVLTEGEDTYLYTGFCARGDKSRTGAMVTVLGPDMLTIKKAPQRVAPGCEYSAGTGFEAMSAAVSVTEQLTRTRQMITRKYHANKYIAYFRNYTNTFLPPDRFRSYLMEATRIPGVVEISVSTRPDCVSAEYLDIMRDIRAMTGIQMNVELGLHHTLQMIDRGHGLAEFIDAVLRIKRYTGISICTHVILNLPGDTAADAKETARILTALGVDIVKLHSLYIARNTRLCDWYENGKITVCSKEEYFERVITFLEQIPETVAVERMFSRIPEKDAVFCNWGCSWWRLRDELLQKMEEEGRYQGRCCDYLNGAALCLLKSE